MSEAERNHAKCPRLPCVAALLCAACVGAAAWTWMRYSYSWTVDIGGMGVFVFSVALRHWLRERRATG